jgi:hypothetical protein
MTRKITAEAAARCAAHTLQDQLAAAIRESNGLRIERTKLNDMDSIDLAFEADRSFTAKESFYATRTP